MEGYGYDITAADVMVAYFAALKLGTTLGREAVVKSQVQALLARERPGGFVRMALR